MTTRLTVTSVRTGTVLDSITADGGTASYDTGMSRPMVNVFAANRGLTPARAIAELVGWSNGYIRFSLSGPAAIAASDGEDDTAYDEATRALVQALDELSDDDAVNAAAFNPALHLHYPKGHPKAGKFMPMVDLLKDAIKKHQAGGSAAGVHPFDGFSRDQLRNAAKMRGITLQRGEDRDSIAAKLLNDLNKPNTSTATPGAPSTPGHKITTKPFKWANGVNAESVEANGNDIGIVVPAGGGQFMAFPGSGSGLMVPPGGPWNSRQEAIDALVRQSHPVPGQPLPPGARNISVAGAAGLKMAELPVVPKTGGWNGKTQAKASIEIFSDGVHIGSVHDWGYGWNADDLSGNSIPAAHASKSKTAAILALVSRMPSRPTPGSSGSKPIVPVSPVGTHGPEITAALDVIFGKDPKGHTIARQVEVYSSLKRHHFDQLGPAEKSTVLGDLSYIATTSKGAGKARAEKLLDRFTPPGTPPGQVPKQAVHVPANVKAAQTRVADPAGTPGLLKVRTDRGQNGDGWTSLPNGQRGPWGKYGAAGVMLRHVGPDGKERFLMVERGPGISDPGKWQFPGGAIDSKENPHEGAARETVEELGFKDSDLHGARVHGSHEVSIPGSTWKYTSIAATVGKQLKPDLSTHHARMETSDAKWMTRDEIDALDSKGKLLKPLAGGQLQTNVMTLFPSSAPTAVRPGPVTQKLPRLTGSPVIHQSAMPTHKQSRGRDLFPDTASKNQLRQSVKKARVQYAGKVADDRLAAIGAMQGFDEVPTIVTKDHMDQLLKTGNYIEAWRGVKGAGTGYSGPTRGGTVSKTKTAKQIQEEFRSGPAYYGKGIFGNGYYFSTKKSVAQGYSDNTPGSLVRVLIPKSANIVPHKVADNGSHVDGTATSKAKGSYESGTLYDEGRWAAAKGHDMIEIDANTSGANHVASQGKPAYNILNRSILIVEEAS